MNTNQQLESGMYRNLSFTAAQFYTLLAALDAAKELHRRFGSNYALAEVTELKREILRQSEAANASSIASR